ncbi:MAG: hypothetical protein J0L51_07110 [Rhizobiales bacterium]|nr:hypothetical protein [Hyphomicrobiales bacterium]
MAKSKTESEETKTEAPRYVVTITAPGGPRRRAGFSFGKEPVHLTEADLDKEKFEALKADTLLVIRDYVEPEAEASSQG